MKSNLSAPETRPLPQTGLWAKSILTLLTTVISVLPVAANDDIQPNPTYLIAGGEHDARLVTPDLLEIRLAGRKESKDGPVKNLEAFQSPQGPRLPEASDYEVTINGQPVGVKEVGYRQELYYAAFKGYDMRVLGTVYLRLEKPATPGSKVSVSTKSGAWSGGPIVFQSTPDEWSPAIQVKQTGYQTDLPKRARVGLYAGTMGEISVEPLPFEVVDEKGATAFQGKLSATKEEGWSGGDYKNVMLADFTSLQKPGVYRLRVPGMGSSKPFRISDGAIPYALRLYALGIYHQLCGGSNDLPFTRHTHDACHTAPAEIPTTEDRFKNTNKHIDDMSAKSYKAENHPAPRMANVGASLYPIQKTGSVDVAGGHHDAGDYSKYVTNGAAFIHSLTTAIDTFSSPQINWDSLGTPESGDGIPDPLQYAKWEADYLVKMQDTDGGFFFLVYPLNRKYEGDVLPENGDSQIVFPKNIISTAAVTGALAELGSSPQFAKHYPKEAKAYLESAKKGYKFLKDAIAKHGLEGSHQVISHYGGLFDHMDELSYAAAAMFAATGDKSYEEDLKTWWPDPNGNKTRRWGWWYLFEGYGMAARVYGFAEKSGRPGGKVADPEYLAKIRNEIIAAGKAQINRAESNAYGLPVPLESKRFRGIGWFWGMDSGMDIAAAATLDPSLREKAIQVLTDCSAYEFGGNPVNRSLVSGSGDRWMREIVHQYAHNDARVLPPSGIPFGNVFGGPHSLEQYKVEGRNGLNFQYVPHLGDTFPFYNRVAADAFNVTAEFTVGQQARNFAAYSFLNSATAAPFPKWSPLQGQIVGLPDRTESGTPLHATLEAKNLPPLSEAQIIWESSGCDPISGEEFKGKAVGVFPGFVEVEAVWPDGRRVMARHALRTAQSNAEDPAVKSANTLALLNFDDLPQGAIPATLPSTTVPFTVEGKPSISDKNVIWSKKLTGNAVYFPDLPHFLELPIDASIPEDGLTVSWWIYPEKFSFGTDGREIITISQGGKRITALRTAKWPKPEAPDAINAKGDILINSAAFSGFTANRWHKVTIQIAPDGNTNYTVDGVSVGEGKSQIQPEGKITVRVGGFRGYADDLHVSRGKGSLSLWNAAHQSNGILARVK
jgi:hypothetical protein